MENGDIKLRYVTVLVFKVLCPRTIHYGPFGTRGIVCVPPKPPPKETEFILHLNEIIPERENGYHLT